MSPRVVVAVALGLALALALALLARFGRTKPPVDGCELWIQQCTPARSYADCLADVRHLGCGK